MSFKRHLFISYAHMDDRPLGGAAKGWITRFHRELEDRLAMRLGYDAKIWRDERLAGNEVFSQEIVDQLPGTAILLSVLSPRYVRSEWCKKEVEEFCRAAETTGGLNVGNKSRVFKIVKTPVVRSDLPPVMQQLTGYDFFLYDGPSTPIELDPAFGPEMVPLYNRKMAKLAAELAETIQRIESTSNGASAAKQVPAGPKRPVVYLAECGYDRGVDRDILETELRSHGYAVRPDRQLSSREEQYINEVSEQMSECSLSIHLIGSDYGMVPYGPSGKSVPILQNEIAIARSKANGMQRIIWALPEVSSANQDQQRFLDKVQGDAEAQFGADLILSDIETVKAAMLSTLRKIEQPKPPVIAAVPVSAAVASDAAAGPGLAYLICDERDKEAVKPLRRWLTNAGYQVRLPMFTNDAATVRQQHQDLLAECDLVILFYGVGDERWKATVESDLWKMKAYRGSKPLPKRCTLIAQPETPDKSDMIEFLEPGMIDATQAFPEEGLQRLIKR